MSEFDLWANLKYLSLEKLLELQPEGWLAVIPYHAEADKIRVDWEVSKEQGIYWLQLEAKRVKEVDYWTARKVLKALQKAADEKAQDLAQELTKLDESYEIQTYSRS